MNETLDLRQAISDIRAVVSEMCLIDLIRLALRVTIGNAKGLRMGTEMWKY